MRARKDLSNSKSDYSELQFKAIDNYLSSLSYYMLCIGDFNAYWGQKVQLDHLVTNIKNKYIRVEYDWSFMNAFRYKNSIQAESKKKYLGFQIMRY